ncbi:Chlorophyll a-b binding protein CP29.2, chloroplastic [Vitis vinifera]|uniref:Chlorophyll a-b binding protein, chloroplastic n=1 Tax=Vitis vinifera TaxID=29760 RepID=A0A438JAH5_VITVI|nr:Chlorophyll a-b binding protein CP29.2, chloroplastic [Vitis vinifera]
MDTLLQSNGHQASLGIYHKAFTKPNISPVESSHHHNSILTLSNISTPATPYTTAMATTTAAAAAAATSSFMGTRLPDVHSNTGRIQARFGFGRKKAPAKKAAKRVSDRPLWFPGAVAPEWLDGTLVGDYGFDPFGLGKPAEYLQYDYDSLDQNLAKNIAGDVIGTRFEGGEVKSTPFQPYTEVFGLQRFRECELILMLATLGALAVESLTGVTWQDAGKVELIEGSSYLGQPLPFSMTTLIWIEVLVLADPEKKASSNCGDQARSPCHDWFPGIRRPGSRHRKRPSTTGPPI